MLAVVKVSQVKIAVPATALRTASETSRLTLEMKRGDEEAFREFFKLYFHRLLGYLMVITRGNETQARDLLQQTMIKVAKHIRESEEQEALWRWLTVLARTSALDEHKKQRRYFGFLERLWTRQSEEASESEPSRNFEQVVRSSLNLLEENDRLLLEAKYLEGRSVREIAESSGESEKGVESRLSRARARLKERLLEELRHE